ncbi:cilia- and flagella-associated protein 68-like [Argopecten irradians]|uniref:cilia- and flagella-associated protein 68-like n=1 Tax=Argopecten irradians TaxID=31199 RepID=UPI00371BE02C
MSMEQEPPFRAMVRASGLGEVWTHTHDIEKFDQFGWRCTNKENSFANSTLVGNWNEERFDVDKVKEAKALPSQYDHYFESTYGTNYNRQPYKVPEELKHLKARHSHAFPGHQPEIDSKSSKAVYNSWETTTRSSYVDPRIRVQPLQPPTQESSKESQ